MQIDLVKWDASSDQLAWKYPSSELSTLAQLIVNESQIAVLFKDGQRLDVFGPGRHVLSNNNIPLLAKLVRLPFGGKSPFVAEVWFLNRAVPLDLKWGTPTPLQVEDPQYGLIVPVSAHGQMGMRVKDPAMFLDALVGTMVEFTTHLVLHYFRGVVVAQLKASLAQAIVRRRVPILQIETELVTLSEDVQRDLQPHFARYGLEVHLFRIMSITVPQDDASVVQLRAAKAAAARRLIEGTNYAQERSFDVLQTGAANPGIGGAFIGVGTGLALGRSLGEIAAQHLSLGTAAGKPQEVPPIFEGAHGPNTSGVPRHYFIHADGAQLGPYSLEQLRALAHAGKLRSDTPTWYAGMVAWCRADELEEVRAILSGLTPPPLGGSL